MPAGEGFADAAVTAEIPGEKAGSASMASMRDRFSVGLGIRLFWSQALVGRRSDRDEI
jgi:hypothetical protein